MNKTYTDGLNDAWKLLKAFCDTEVGKRQEVFGEYVVNMLVENMSPQEALAKLEAYEKSKEINVGDVVESNVDGKKYLILTETNDGEWDFVALDIEQLKVIRIVGSNYYFKKTNKHIDINSLLEQLRGE